MKLLRLKINKEEGFNSLFNGFEMNFLPAEKKEEATVFNPYVLAGKNGSGKSNVLEALSEIFYHLDCIYLSNKPTYFDEDGENNSKSFDSKISRVDAYELEYLTFITEGFPQLSNKKEEIKKAHIFISKKIGERPKIEWKNKDEFGVDELLSHQIKFLLPEYVVGYASGENETLSFPFFKSRFIQYDSYYSNLITESIIDPSPESSLIYVDKSYSQFILLANLLMNTNDDLDKDILSPFKEYVGIEEIDSFRLIIKTDILKEFEGKKYPLLKNLDFDVKREGKNTSSYIEKLKKCATSWYEEDNYDFYENEFNNSSFLILDYKVNPATIIAFQFHFENNPLKLFELFQLLLILEIHSVNQESKNNTYATENIFLSESINFRPIESKRVLNIKNFEIKKKGIEKNIYTKVLSDGEHQFLHSLGLCLLFKDTRSLFLLDEPETHFNPSWKAKFLSSLRYCFEQQENDSSETMREMLITTHSPYLLSDSDSQYVQIFKKGEAPFHPDFQTFGTSVNSIGIKIFNMPNTIGKVAQKRITDYKEELKEIESSENVETFILKVKTEMGESVERLLLLNDAYKKIE
ncbi:restriction system-associated AAA family ATPase [Salegentibacter sp. Hel_I_6]|uniref:restriction system-associated AAA family ATPase n=1 Tax=Salegentibacter sp. Hel_I_6 TaxID=1250278 RepID=UPI000566682B|nr:restriction system-associated AAA family ATPase [Salegentibacter sp. Hel_I_6]